MLRTSLSRVGNILANTPLTSRLASPDLRTAYTNMRGNHRQTNLLSREMDAISGSDPNVAATRLNNEISSLDQRSARLRERGDVDRADQVLEQANARRNILSDNFTSTTADDGRRTFDFAQSEEARRQQASALNETIRGRDRDMVGDAFGAVKDYYRAADDDGRIGTIAARAGVTAGAYMGANVGMRYMNGGGLTYNNRGERDIAGIPFI